MRRLFLLAAAGALALTPLAVQADPGKGKAKGHSVSHPHGGPPGQVKKQWSRGQRLPMTYVSQRYYVTEPSRYDLAPPPVGYRWVLVEDHYYLTQTRTGLIAQVVAALLG